MTTTTYLRAVNVNDSDFAQGDGSFAVVEVVSEDGSTRPATQDDVDACSQNWKQLAPGHWECHD